MTGVYKIQNVLTEFLTAAKNTFLRLFAQSTLEKDKKAPAISDGARRAQINVNAEWLLQQYGNSVLRLAYSYLHNMSDAEDVLQDTLVQYIKTEPNLNQTATKRPGLCVWQSISAKTKFRTTRSAKPMN